jgi:tRNA uridine 5-carbamoylmethylation protein Kti12
MEYRIIIVVGLPCSGKSFLSNTFKDYMILDDYYCNHYTAELNELISKNTKLCINDPRLCYKLRFASVVKEIKKY